MLTIVSFFSQLPFAVAKGFMLNKWEILFIYLSIGLLLSALINKKMNMIYLALFSSLIISSNIFYKRLENNKYCLKYIHREYPKFQIIKSNTSNYFIIPKYTWNSNKTQRIMKDFTTLYPGRNILIPLERLEDN